jgi:3-dehydroquinate synthase
MQRLRAKAEKFAYEVVVGSGAWKALRTFPMASYSSVFVLTERPLWNRWANSFCRAGGLKEPRCVFVPAGENSKSLRMVERVASRLLEGGADRRSLLIAFGGGVVGDLGGFVAATYMRGIDYLQAPTTLLAQVDSSIGGKTGVDVGAMKNLIGAFYPPRLVVSDPVVLRSLPTSAFASGLYEMIKHAILAGGALFTQLDRSLERLRPANARMLGPLVADAAHVKIKVVSRDEREAGLRRVLNLGHTYGHALEEATGYRRFSHGQAVGWGILLAARLAERLAILDQSEGEKIASLVRRVGRLPAIHDLSVDRILRLLPRDKKAVGGRIHWVLPERIGKVRIVNDVPEAEAAAALRDLQRAERHE